MASSEIGRVSRGWAFLACRILSLYVLYIVIQYIPGIAINIANIREADTNFFQSIFPIYFAGLNFLMFLFFWFGAPWLSNRLAPPKAEDTVSGDWNIEQWMSLIVAVYGLILIVDALPLLAGNLAAYIGIGGEYYVRSSEIAAKAIVGTVLIFGRHRVSEAIKSARRW
jgi:hypothetical protein